jgi:hypothetical protein
MRKLFALTLMTLSLVGTAAMAQDAEPAAGSLKKNMKEAGVLFKAIGATVKDSTKNAENAVAAQKISDLFKLAKEQTPDAFEDIPEAHRAAAFTEYQTMMQKTIDLADQLVLAFTNNDNAAAANIYQQLKDAKGEGHDRFDP